MSSLKLAGIVTAAAYLIARIGFTWHDANPILFTLLLAAEIFGMWRLWIEISLVRTRRGGSADATVDEAQRIDAVVVVTDEPASEVRAAVLSARMIEGVRRVTVVDRDDRSDVLKLADRLSIDRFAGNSDGSGDVGRLIDTALARSESEFAVIMPADVVALPDVVTTAAPLFADSTTAVVLCRIDHVNSVNADLNRYRENERWAALVNSGRSGDNSVPWWSSISVVRPSAILSCGGLSCGGEGRSRSGGTLEAGLRLQQAGWQIVETPEVAARRLASWSEDRHLHRWARELQERLVVLGSPQLKRRHAGLTRTGRRAYTAALVQVLQPIQRLTLIGVLMATLYTSALPLTSEIVPLVMLWGAWHVASISLRFSASSEFGFSSWISSDLRFMTTNLVVARRVLRGDRHQTDLTERAPGRVLRTVVMSAIQISLAGSLVVFGAGIMTMQHGDFATAAALLFAAWFLAASARWRLVTNVSQTRRSYRTFDNLRVLNNASKMRIFGVSLSGVDVVSRTPMEKGETVRLVFDIPQGNLGSTRFESTLVVHRSSRKGRFHVSYMRFPQLSDDEYDRLIAYCSVVGASNSLPKKADDASVGGFPSDRGGSGESAPSTTAPVSSSEAVSSRVADQ